MKRSELFFSLLQVPIDAAMILIAFVLSYYLRIKTDILPVNSNVPFRQYLTYVALVIPIWLIIYAISGLYRIARSRNYYNDLYRIIFSNAIVILIFIVAIFFGRAFFFSRLILIFIMFFSVFFVFIGRVVLQETQRLFYRLGKGIHKIIIIGDNEVSKKIAQTVNSTYRLGLKLVGVVSEDNESFTEMVGYKYIGNISQIDQIAKEKKPDEIILTDIGIDKKQVMHLVELCTDEGIAFKFIPDVLSMITTSVSSNVLGGFPVMELKTIPLDGWGRIIKRVSDIFFSFLFMLILSPILLLVAIFEKLTSPGPIIYSHERVGRDGKTFMLHKFRSMYIDAEKNGRFWTEANDDRITPLGKIIRKTNLDELPQLWNIFVGDMSFVGPRPEQPRFVEKFNAEVPDYFKRHRVKSGLTGWAVVNGLKGDTSISERVKFDIYYIENWSIGFDLKIIIKTFLLVIGETFGGKYEYRDRS